MHLLLYYCCVRVAQLDRALGYGPRCREFESSHARTRISSFTWNPFFAYKLFSLNLIFTCNPFFTCKLFSLNLIFIWNPFFTCKLFSLNLIFTWNPFFAYNLFFLDSFFRIRVENPQIFNCRIVQLY